MLEMIPIYEHGSRNRRDEVKIYLCSTAESILVPDAMNATAVRLIQGLRASKIKNEDVRNRSRLYFQITNEQYLNFAVTRLHVWRLDCFALLSLKPAQHSCTRVLEHGAF
jgi:hypothetical protein